MKKGLMLLATAAAVFFIAACSTVRPVAGATGMVGSKAGIFCIVPPQRRRRNYAGS